MFIKGMLYPFRRKRLDNASKKGKLYQILLEKDSEFKPVQYVSFFERMHTMFNPWNQTKWFTIEFYGNHKGVHLYAWLSKGVPREFLQASINAVHPASEVIPAKDYMKEHNNFEQYHKACAIVELERHFLFPLEQSDGTREMVEDMITALCSAMQNLNEHQHIGVQFVLRPVHRRVAKIAKAYLDAYRKTGAYPDKRRYPYNKWTPYLSVPKKLIQAFRHAARKQAKDGKDVIPNHDLAPLLKKAESGVYFDLMIRVFCAHKKSVSKPAENLQTVLSAFAPTSDQNRLVATRRKKDRTYFFNKIRVYPTSKLMKEYAKRRVSVYPLENYVTPSELTTILHFPNKHVPNVVRLKARKLPVPAGIFMYDTLEQAWADNAIVFGKSDYRGRTKFLAFKDIKMLMQHMYCIGNTGSGKSFFLSLLALQVARHTGLTFFDVKGDVIDDFMRHLPKSEWNRVVYIDLYDSLYYLPLNILKQPGMSIYNLATMIVSTFVKVFSEGSIKEHSESVLRKALIAVISCDPEGSLLEVYRMYTDEAYLDEIIRRMEEAGDAYEYADVRSYWRDVFKPMKRRARKAEAGAILNKLEMITQNERPRYTLCQKENVLNWRKMMDERKIILVNLSWGQNDKKILSFFGTLFTSFISIAAFSRDDTPREQRVPHIFIVDEFEMFIRAEEDMQKFLELARSYGLGLVLAHQSLKQITSPKLLGILKDMPYSQIALMTGSDSAPALSKMFSSKSAPVEEEDLISMPEYTGYARFRKLATPAFTFDALNMSKIFDSVSWEEVEEWKQQYKEQHYRHVDEIKDDINRRYRMVDVTLLREDEEDSKQYRLVKTGDTTGKIQRKQENLFPDAEQMEVPSFLKGVKLNGKVYSNTENVQISQEDGRGKN